MSVFTRKEYTGEPVAVNGRGMWFRGLPVMETWEKPHIEAYIQRVLSEVKPRTVLEIGYGLGYTAQAIQDYGVDTHWIVEAHPIVLDRLKLWARSRPTVVVIDGFVEDVTLPQSVDLIFDDRHDMTNYGNGWIKKVAHRHYERFDVERMMVTNG